MNHNHTFVVLAHGFSPYLDGCLDTLAGQTVRSRVLVSTSTPNELIESAVCRHSVELVVNEVGGGIGADWNFGLRVANTRYVTLIHQDDTYMPNFLERSLMVLKKYEGALVFTGYEEVDNDGLQTSSKISRVKHLIEAVTLGRVRCVPNWRMRAYLAFGVPLPCSSVTYDLNKFEGFAFSTEYAANLDWDAWLRLLDSGKQFVRDPARLVGRRHNPLTATSQALANGTRAREDLQLFRRIWPKPIADLIAIAYRTGY